MADADTRSLQQIKRETEQTRAGLTNTVEQLKTSVAETANDIRHRISPDAIKAEVSGYIRSRGEQLLNDVTSAARRNPMQAVAVGASVAYPLLKLARAIPFPVLMVGAGLFFAGSKTGQAAHRKHQTWQRTFPTKWRAAHTNLVTRYRMLLRLPRIMRPTNMNA